MGATAVGAFLAPFASTIFSTQPRWTFHYSSLLDCSSRTLLLSFWYSDSDDKKGVSLSKIPHRFGAGTRCVIGVNRWIGEERVVYVYTFSHCTRIDDLVRPIDYSKRHRRLDHRSTPGPLFPIIVSHSSRILPHWMLTACVGWITSIGVSGSAVLPFITGILASRFGIKSLQPL
ncbi:hypothetical protein BKA70DRAFT_1493679 [Coprinopsis sp. MPI-PUGE-AT-0042]|nr:hypothetical protein BKA70DRAFT_1493679 [Coprinopsis sp. MPI-PUGE-AT-0042]